MAKTKFTAGRVEDFTCEGGKIPSFLWDSAAPGLGLRAAPGGGKAFIFQAKLKGQVIRITIGAPKTWSIAAAQAEARRLKVIIDNGQDPRHVKAAGLAAEQTARDVKAAAEDAAAAAAVRDAITVGEAWTDYITTRRAKWGDRHYLDHVDKAKAGGKLSTRGTRGRGVTIDGPLYPLMSLRLRDLDAATIETWAEGEAITRPTAGRLAWRLLKVFLTWCTEHKDYSSIVSARNPAKTKKSREALGKSNAKSDVLQKSQLPAWFDAARNLTNPVMSACLQTILLTGARPGEVLEMRWEDVNFKWKGINIRDKVEGERQIPLPPYLESLLTSLPRRNEWVFAGMKNAHITSPNSQMASVCKVAGIEGLTLHGLRRSFKSLCEWLEIPAGVVAQIMGHKPSATAEKHYTVRPLDLLRLHHERIEAWLLAQAGIEFKPAPAGLRIVSAA